MGVFDILCVVVTVAAGIVAYLAQRRAVAARALLEIERMFASDASAAVAGRDDGAAELVSATGELLERQHGYQLALTERERLGSSSRSASAEIANDAHGSLDIIGALTRDVGVASSAFEETIASISVLSTNIGAIADNVTSVSSSIGELAVSVNHVAESARVASTLSIEADRKAKDGGVAVERLVASTREIADDIASVVAKMRELGTASERIGAIVQVIDTIADQTNLLALNAAIEAARAGEHGRGFAVVADEVRKLAESSAQSTREIGSLIKDIQNKTAEVVRFTTESGSKAESGLSMADVAGRAIGDVSSAVAEANGLIEQISLAAREQAAGSTVIVNSVETMNSLMREAAGSLDEQNTANLQMVSVIGAIQQHAKDVENISGRQQAAFARYSAARDSSVAARSAADEARAALDSIVETVRERIEAMRGSRSLAVTPPRVMELR